MTPQNRTKSYLAVVAALITLLLGIVLGINSLADPLFFFGGNKITGKGYYLNERISVIARNRDHWADIDCVIFGSSRMTLLDASRISGHSCANLAFSGGLVDEFIDYANYLKAQGLRPKLIIIGVDNYASPFTLTDVPEFIRNRENIPNWFSYYTSIDTLRFSLAALTGTTKSPNYYDGNYRKYIGFPARQPGGDHGHDNFYVLPGQQNAVAARAPYYQKLCRIFPGTRCMGIVPPVSSWGVEKALTQGTRPYLESMESLSGVFDAFYDFSVPAKPEWDFSGTNDGIHFTADVFDHVAAKISNPGREGWGFDVKSLPPEVYEQRYIEAAQKAVTERRKLNGHKPDLATASVPPD